MRDLYSDDYDSVTGASPDRLVPGSVRKLAGAAVFLGLIAVMGLWSYRLGTRDANAVPIVRAMEGPTRIQPGDPGGTTAAHQGLEVNNVLAGDPAPVPRNVPSARPEPVVLTDEDGAQGELIVAESVMPSPLGADGEAPMPNDGLDPAEETAAAPVSLQSELAAMVQAVAPSDADGAVSTDARPRGRPANLAPARAPAPSAAPTQTAALAPASAPAVREVGKPPAGSRLVQLGAYDSEALARQAWTQLLAKQGDLLGSKSLYVERTTSNARVFYRLRVAGFQDTEQTRSMCEALRARGIDCIPVTLQ